ncbi:MAG TPA: aminodeoxychorismate synthase component I [Chthoniobacteraceae bacterium]|jgi:aminodeoxychorismate synthase component I
MAMLAHPPRAIDLRLSPVEVAARCRHLPGLVFFDTAHLADSQTQTSIVAARPERIVRGRSEADWTLLREALREAAVEPSPDDGLPHGFAAGYVEYDGAFWFGFYQDALFFRHADQRWSEIGELSSALQEPAASSATGRLDFAPDTSPEAFCAMIRQAQEYIAAGDIYQVNLAHRFQSSWRGDAFRFYEKLRDHSPAPYAAYLDCGERQVLSSSPESFLQMSDRSIRTRPIKGTRPRRADPTADEKSAFDLLTSPKEVAELVMITDLERSDLGQICEVGSVTVSELLKLERFQQVFHLVSTIQGQLRPEVDHLAALRACFPGGSITGAPKKRAREIIAELEPSARGLYTGALGWFGFNGESQFSIAIRTVVMEGGKAHFHVGAGIVADSSPSREWQETLDKAAGILLAAERLGGSR